MRWIITATVLAGLAGAVFAEPVSVETARGEVNVAAPVERIVAFPAGVIDTLDALGVPLVGIPSDVHLDYLRPSEAVPIGTLFSADIEALHRLQPDLVIVGTRSAAQYASVSKVAPTVDLSLASGNHYQAAVERMHQLAKLTGTVATAERIEQQLQHLVMQVKQRINPDDKVMVIMLMGRALHMLTARTRIDWFESELGMNLINDPSKQLGELAPISYEYIVAKNPDWLIVFDRDAAVGITAHSNAEQYLDNPLVQMTRASKAEHIIYLDGVGTLNAVGGVQGVQRTLQQLKNGFARPKEDQE